MISLVLVLFLIRAAVFREREAKYQWTERRVWKARACAAGSANVEGLRLTFGILAPRDLEELLDV